MAAADGPEPSPPARPDSPEGVLLPESERTRLRRMPERAVRERAALDALLDAAFLCHLALVVDGWPVAIPTSYGRSGDELVVHGSVASRSLRGARGLGRASVTVTLLDGLVLARSVFEHSVNYRSAMVFGEPEVLAGDEKLEGLRVLTEHVAPGQWDYARRPSARELAQTTVLRLRLDEASVKLRSGGPEDGGGEDGALPLWAGEIPLRTRALLPVPDAVHAPAGPLPPHLEALAAAIDRRLAPPG